MNLSPFSHPFTEPYEAAESAAARLHNLTGIEGHDVALVMGSGWEAAADVLGPADFELPVTDLPGFPAPAVEGHAGRIRSVRVGDHRVLVFLGRVHLYEGRGVDPVVHGVRTAIAAGCRTVVLTNACGGLRPDHVIGQPVLISDHINLTGASPVTGPHFVSLTHAYSPRLRALCRRLNPALTEGVYVQMRGPQYETPAEIRMARAIGGDLVGMSTALETIAARQAGVEVLGISLVTNLAAGLAERPLDHTDVLAAGSTSAQRMGHLLRDLLGRL